MAELATLTSNPMLLHSLSADGLGTVEELADRIWASEATEYRAASLVRRAVQELAEAHRKMKDDRRRRVGRKR